MWHISEIDAVLSYPSVCMSDLMFWCASCRCVYACNTLYNIGGSGLHTEICVFLTLRLLHLEYPIVFLMLGQHILCISWNMCFTSQTCGATALPAHEPRLQMTCSRNGCTFKYAPQYFLSEPCASVGIVFKDLLHLQVPRLRQVLLQVQVLQHFTL